MNLEQFLKSKNFKINEKLLMQPYHEMWEQWYAGDIKSFQIYNVYNGNKTIQCKRKTLNMAKKVCEDIANLLMNEKVIFHIGKKKTQKEINEILDYNDFYKLANEAVEKTFALSQGAFVVSLGDLNYNIDTEEITTEDAKIKIDFATVDKIYPLSYEGTKITECAFAINKTINNQNLCMLSIHKKNEKGNYVITNYAFKVDNGGQLTDISDKIDDMLLEIDTMSNKPWFSILEPRLTNNIKINSPYSISLFANSIDVLKGIDIAYDSYVNEFVLGKRRIFVASDLLQPDIKTGQQKEIFDTNDVVFHLLPGEDNKGAQITTPEMELRMDDHEKGIQLGLNLLASKIGFGEERYKFNKNGVTTATQVISENSEMYRTIKKHEINLENTLVDLLKTICYVAKKFLGKPVEEEPEITIDFDDSIIEDKSEKKRQAQLEYNYELIDKVEYFVETRGMTEEQAIQFIKKMEERRKEEMEDEPEKEDDEEEV